MLPKVNPARVLALMSSRVTVNTGLKGNFVIGATFVKRQSSSLIVGNPSSANCAIPALRKGNTQGGCLVSFSNRSNFSRYGSVSFINLGLISSGRSFRSPVQLNEPDSVP